MFARKGLFSSIGRAGAVATVVAVALTAVEPSMAFAGSATSGKGVTASAGTSDATDISARRYHRRYSRYGYYPRYDRYRPFIRPYYYARPSYYRPYPYYAPAPFPFGFGFGPDWW